jgi:prepilin-type N-terminal cleavage/methylation domain-containing protein
MHFIGCVRRKRGFTLIELLVVVAIIALLISILLPSLAAARDSAKATLCGANLKHAAESTQLWMIDLQQNNLLTNAGWAAGALRMAQGQTGWFACPSDVKPTPVPAFFVEMHHGDEATPYAVASADGPFNTISANETGTWNVNFQDEIQDGGDGDMVDTMYTYTVSDGAKTTTVTQSDIDAGSWFRVTDYKGRTVFPNAKLARGSSFTAPLLWGSFGLNITSGARNVKGNPILLAEYSNWGVFSEPVHNFPRHILKQKLRLRHGGKAPATAKLTDPNDRSYVARDRGNCAFRDGHVERVTWNKLVQIQTTTSAATSDYDPARMSSSAWYSSVWLGTPCPRPAGWQPKW